jgi:hypothetical protein
MCAKCTELNDQIARYYKLAKQVTDQRTLEGIAGLVKQMTDEKAGLHPELACK